MWVNDASITHWPEGASEIMMRVVPADKLPSFSIPWAIQQAPNVISGRAELTKAACDRPGEQELVQASPCAWAIAFRWRCTLRLARSWKWPRSFPRLLSTFFMRGSDHEPVHRRRLRW